MVSSLNGAFCCKFVASFLSVTYNCKFVCYIVLLFWYNVKGYCMALNGISLSTLLKFIFELKESSLIGIYSKLCIYETAFGI